MATKKTATSKAPAKTATPAQAKAPAAKAAAKATSTSAVSAGAFAASPAPEHTRADPESAATELLKTLVPKGAPAPVFSTQALTHGLDASGAAGMREGFAWNTRMDLLWAIGYPECFLIVDGLPETKEGILDVWDPNRDMKAKHLWKRHSQYRFPRLISRRGALALLHESDAPDNPFYTEDVAFTKASEPYEIQSQDALRILRATQTDFDRVAYLLEALIGPDLVAATLLELILDHKAKTKTAEQAASTLQAVLQRLPSTARKLIIDELKQLKLAKDSGLADFISATTEPVAWAQANPKYELATLIWVRGQEELALKGFRAQIKDRPDMPGVRDVYAGGAPLAVLECQQFKKYNPEDVVGAYLNFYTSIRAPWLLPAVLELTGNKAARPALTVWARKHAADLKPELENLARDAKLAKQAQTLLGLAK